MTDTRVLEVLAAVKPTMQDRLELYKLGRSLTGISSLDSVLLRDLVNSACEVAYVPSREFSMDLTIEQVLYKAHEDAQVDRLNALRNIVKHRIGN